MSISIGVIAESSNDIAVLDILTSKIINKSDYKFRQWAANGCGNLRKKCSTWAETLKNKGCTFLIVMHDRDEHDLEQLKKKLNKCICGIDFNDSIILIPITELEAWLMCDSSALQKVLSTKTLPKLPSNPEEELDPKAKIGEISKKANGSKYIHPIHNTKIAEALDVKKLLKKCSAFKPYAEFLKQVVS